MKDVLAFVGPSGAGKSTLIMELLRQRPDKVGNLLSVTSRPSRGTVDDELTYEFVSKEEFEARVHEGAFIHWVRHADNYYGTLRRHADEVLRERYAVGAFVQQGVQNLRNAGCRVRVIKVSPIGGMTHDERRKYEDAERDKIDVFPELIVENSFASGGREKAIAAVLAYVDALP